jgi:signal transduction histidine kinase
MEIINQAATLHGIDNCLALTAALINGLFVILILTRTSRATVYVTFLFNCLATVIWTFSDFMDGGAKNTSWFYFSLIGTGFIPALMFHFTCALTGSTNVRGWIWASYILCVPLALTSLLAPWNSGIRHIVDGRVWDALFVVSLSAFYLAGMAILARAIKRAKSKSEAGRLRYVLVAVSIGCVFGIINVLWEYKPLDLGSPLGHLGTVIYSSILAISVFRHRAAYDLVAGMRTKLDMINELAAGIAHELRNPLSSIKGAASLLGEKYGKSSVEESKEYLNMISEEVEHLDAILTNYRGLIKPAKVEREPVFVNSIIERTVALVRMNGDGLRIELSLSPDVPFCRSDPQTLRQVFINLIKNAKEACGPESVLRITTEHVSPSVRITFSDTGKGISPEILPHLFEPFVSTKANGMGLGLAICRRLIDLNEGTIEAANDAGGARFTIHLPAEGRIPRA